MALALCIAAPAFAADHGISGAWFVENPDQPMRPLDGTTPSLTEAGRTRLSENEAWLSVPHPPTKTDLTACIPQPGPRLLTMRYPLRIAEKTMPGAGAVSDFVLFVYEHNSTFRFVYMNEEHKSEADTLANFVGNAVGRWEDDALIVDSRYFNMAVSSMLDSTGLPFSSQLHAVERYTKRPDGKLDVLVTIEDPVMYTKPWQFKRTLEKRPGDDVKEYACGVGDLSTRDTRGGP
jgi:hypothetical protein